MKFSRDIIMAVREMMERHWSLADMSARLGIDANDIQTIIDIINQVT
jgi:hypothetical protein